MSQEELIFLSSRSLRAFIVSFKRIVFLFNFLWVELVCLCILTEYSIFTEKPPPPINIAVKERTMEEVHLKWSHPENHEAYRIQAYVVRYYRSSRPNDSHNSSVAASHREFVLNELEQGTEYEIRMSSTNSKGEGRLTDPIRVTTKNNDIGN